VQHPCLPLRLTVPSPDAEWEVLHSLVIRKMNVTLNTAKDLHVGVRNDVESMGLFICGLFGGPFELRRVNI
jgi:hypothetical protein